MTARRLPELQALATELEAADKVSVTPVAADLGKLEGLTSLLAACARRDIGILVNNAGFGGRGAFVSGR